LPAREVSRLGLTLPPQAVTASPAALMLTAALTSRSCRTPQDSHAHSRTASGIFAARCPHAEHVFELGYQRSTTTRSRPYQSHLYSSMPRRSAHAVSLIARARAWLRTMFRTDRS